jgi:hypothetical protein
MIHIMSEYENTTLVRSFYIDGTETVITDSAGAELERRPASEYELALSVPIPGPVVDADAPAIAPVDFASQLATAQTQIAQQQQIIEALAAKFGVDLKTFN